MKKKMAFAISLLAAAGSAQAGLWKDIKKTAKKTWETTKSLASSSWDYFKNTLYPMLKELYPKAATFLQNNPKVAELFALAFDLDPDYAKAVAKAYEEKGDTSRFVDALSGIVETKAEKDAKKAQEAEDIVDAAKQEVAAK